MRATTNVEEQKEIYVNGRNALQDDGETRSLASLSLNISGFEEDPMFNLFRHSFAQENGLVTDLVGGQPSAQYANTMVMLYFSSDSELAIKAVIAFNVWMYAVHELHVALQACKRNDQTSQDEMLAALDIAAALWIGSGQVEGDNKSGYMLYNLAEFAGQLFGQDQGETAVNTRFIDAMKTLQSRAREGSCTNNATGYVEFRTIVRRTIGIMTIPLVQMMIHHVITEGIYGQTAYGLYADSINARLEACVRPAALSWMPPPQEVLAYYQSAYSCLQVTCSDIGSYRHGLYPACKDKDTPPQMMGYQASTSGVPYANFDRDIIQIWILTRMGAFSAAQDYYMYGYNVPSGDSFDSLRGLATSPTRSVASGQFELFSSFFGSDDYADAFFLKVLSGEPPFDSLSNEQLAQQASDVLRFSVLYMTILESLYGAIAVCRGGGDAAERVLLVDRAVALYVGSMEVGGGVFGGTLMYSTSTRWACVFDTCKESDIGSDANAELIGAFQELSFTLLEGNCDDGFAMVENGIAPLLLVPLVQGLLGETESRFSGDKQPFSFLMSIVPLLDHADSSATAQLVLALDLQSAEDPMSDEAVAGVFRLMQEIVPKMTLPNLPSACPYIGVFEGYPDVCEGVNQPDSKSSSSVNATALPLTPKASVASFAPVVAPTVAPTQLSSSALSNQDNGNKDNTKGTNKKKGKKMNGMKMNMSGKKMNGMKMMGKKKAKEFATETEEDEEEDETSNR